MVKTGQTVVYRGNVCYVKELVKQYRGEEDYYKLVPVYDASMTIHTPVATIEDLARPVISKREVERLIRRMPDIECVTAENRTLEHTYKALLDSKNHEDLIRIIKTAYMRGEEKLNRGQQRNEKDKQYIRVAEKTLYSEFAVVLNKSYDETKAYVVSQVEALRPQVVQLTVANELEVK